MEGVLKGQGVIGEGSWKEYRRGEWLYVRGDGRSTDGARGYW